MSISTVKAALDAIAESIVKERTAIIKVKNSLGNVKSNLAALPSLYEAEIGEINGYVPTGPYETLAKDELAKLTAEFITVSSAVDNAIAALS